MAARTPVGYAVVGLGHIAQAAVLPAFRHARKSRLIAVVSSDRQKADRIASEFGAPRFYGYDDYDACLAEPEIAAVYIATINSAHLQFALRAAARGKHVLCEKPLANTSEECRQIVDACRKHGVKLMTAYRKYFEPACVALKKLVASGRLGKLRLIQTAFTNMLPASGVWHLDFQSAGGGSLMDLGIYCVNTARWLSGQEPTEAAATTWWTDPQRFASVEENIAFQLKFPDGLCMQGASSFTAARASFLQLYGEKGWAALDPAYPYTEERRFFGKIGGKWFEKEYPRTDEFTLELDHFADCIRRNRGPQPDGVTGLRDVAIIEAIYQAAKLGRPVPIRLPL